ncbi:hypothetical protein V6U90_24410 [Micromonospora sp. CPCC 206060]|uniref:hypothetical protein n=1 Tax=Micromonospora sp. CPCC 206060 TaxID=3122406 RepID=UPI002FF12424
MSDELALFDLPTLPEPRPALTRSGRGRARERYARSVAADVTVQRIPVLLDAAVRAFDDSLTVDADDEAPDSRAQIGRDPAAALSWLLDPTDRMWPLLEAGSASVLSAEIDIDKLSSTRYRLRWTMTIQLRDVAAFRRIALDACPAEDTTTHAEIAASLAAAWQQAAPPFAPLHRIPGITWSPVEAVVAHVPARPERNPAE